METDLENLQTRRSNILTELASLAAANPGGRPNIGGGAGGIVDHVGYKDGLYRELENLNRLIAQLDHFEFLSEG